MQYNTSSYHLFGKNNSYIDIIINKLNLSQDQMFCDFMAIFFDNVSLNNLSDREIDLYADLSLKAYNFIQKKEKNNPKIEIYNPEFTDEDNKYSVIQVLKTDMAFIVDSIEANLRSKNIEIFNRIHPVLNVRRGEQGELLNLVDKAKGHPEDNESLTVICVEYIADPKDQQILISGILEILENVRLAVTDWKEIVKKVNFYTQSYIEKAHADPKYQERVEFLSSVEDKYFVFLGSVDFDVKLNEKKLIFRDESVLGILKENKNLSEAVLNIVNNSARMFDSNFHIEIGKLNRSSIIHRTANLDYICSKKFDHSGNLISISFFIGLFTSILYYQSVTLIPIIRRKVFSVIDRANFSHGSHGAKELISIIESLPRDELFQISEDELYKITMEVYAMMHQPDLKLFFKQSNDFSIANALIFIPFDRVNSKSSKKLYSIINSQIGEIIDSTYVHINHSKMCYYHIIAKNKFGNEAKFDLNKIEQELNQATLLWTDLLNKTLESSFPKAKGTFYYKKYKDAFPEAYKEKNAPSECIIHDILNLEKLQNDNEIIFSVSKIDVNQEKSVQLKIYSKFEIPLSDIIPMVQNIGFKAFSEYIFKIKYSESNNLWIHHFYLSTNLCQLDEISKDNIEDILFAIWNGKALNDEYNKLTLNAKLTYREVSLLRAIGKYLYQINFGYSKEYIGQVLTAHPIISKLIIDMFDNKFNPKIKNDSRDTKTQEIYQLIKNKLADVLDPVEDKVLTKYLEIIENIVRTNYFVQSANGELRDFISFKINSKNISNIPKPIPFMEIFVYSSFFEAIHLRSAKVSRGGIRWSDRTEDFRTEVLDLVKAQIPKNSVIVPGGAKGGFVVKRTPEMTNEEFYNLGVECYKKFLRGLLDITDNIIKDEIVHPENVVVHDNKDPYLVVAADKGTATFSDTANLIAKEYNFWLGDAFASGGSAGYDHKKMGITAKGAWISVIRHFSEIGIDPQRQDFTVIGIGDMSGDVFGNGMLLSEHIKLVAAFNHMHIFLDPNPDSKKSFQERKRLFNLKRSTWDDYNKELLSVGGMIYSRNSKSLALSDQIRNLLDIEEKSISPDELIKYILKANVDLLWNGGIGTYVKSKRETHADVGDKTNDNVRVNGSDLRCKVVAEGGNLGLTQAGRIEYARSGGRINKDSIDNSAGVDCSDHEVNIKIVLDKAVKNKKITESERNELLEQMTDKVAELVLEDNWLQTLALSITKNRSYNLLHNQERLLNMLENEGVISRKIEALPSGEEFDQLNISKQGLTVPELAILLAYSKLSINQHVLESQLVVDKYFDNHLENYFPSFMKDKFSEEIHNHPLRKEIISTIITNNVVNKVSTFFVHITAEETGYKFCDIIRAFIVTRDVFKFNDFWLDLEKYQGKIDHEILISIYVLAKKFIMRSTVWLLRNSPSKIDIIDNINEYSDGISKLSLIIDKYLIASSKDLFESTLQKYIDAGLTKDVARKAALLKPMLSAYNIVYIANKCNFPIEKIAELYFKIANQFDFDWLKSNSDNLIIENNWQRLAVKEFKDELYDIHREITLSVINSSSNDLNLDLWLKDQEKIISRYNKIISEIKEVQNIDYTMLELAIKKLKLLVK